MKSLTRLVLAGMALLMLSVPMTAQAQEWRGYGGYGCGWRHRDIAWDRHNLHRQWRDIGRDRWELRQDYANDNWGAARAERADIQRDLMRVRRQRWDLYRDYRGLPGPNMSYMPPANYVPVPRTNYLPPAAYVPPVNNAYVASAYPTYPGGYYNAPTGQGLGALLGSIIP